MKDIFIDDQTINDVFAPPNKKIISFGQPVWDNIAEMWIFPVELEDE